MSASLLPTYLALRERLSCIRMGMGYSRNETSPALLLDGALNSLRRAEETLTRTRELVARWEADIQSAEYGLQVLLDAMDAEDRAHLITEKLTEQSNEV